MFDVICDIPYDGYTHDEDFEFNVLDLVIDFLFGSAL